MYVFGVYVCVFSVCVLVGTRVRLRAKFDVDPVIRTMNLNNHGG